MSSKTERQVALNFETDISSIGRLFLPERSWLTDHGHIILWNLAFVNAGGGVSMLINGLLGGKCDRSQAIGPEFSAGFACLLSIY